MEDFNGILLIDKPTGWTSFDVVAKVRGIIKKETGQKIKIGHCGTLDPFATGLLVLVLGSYTKKAQEYTKLDKSYEVESTLGFTSTTGDPEGELTEISTQVPKLSEVEQTLKKFVGQIEQIPPAYSAIKVNGERAYKLARAGKEVKIEPRKVLIHSITNIKYAYPKVLFICSVSSGTYVRTLSQDIGKVLTTGAHTSALKRTKVGEFNINDAIELDNINYETIKNSLQIRS